MNFVSSERCLPTKEDTRIKLNVDFQRQEPTELAQILHERSLPVSEKSISVETVCDNKCESSNNERTHGRLEKPKEQ